MFCAQAIASFNRTTIADNVVVGANGKTLN
jgi:hypothetical protein